METILRNWLLEADSGGGEREPSESTVESAEWHSAEATYGHLDQGLERHHWVPKATEVVSTYRTGSPQAPETPSNEYHQGALEDPALSETENPGGLAEMPE